MALAQDKTVAVGPVRVSRIVTHDAEIQRCDYVGRRQRSAGMAAARGRDHADDVPPQLAGDALEVLYIIIGHRSRQAPGDTGGELRVIDVPAVQFEFDLL
jgi:hypothetical protein